MSDATRAIEAIDEAINSDESDAFDVYRVTREHWPAARAHIRTLEEQVARLTAIVQRVEWLGRNAGFMGRCPLCEAIKGDPHKPGCDLADALAKSGMSIETFARMLRKVNGPPLFVPADAVAVSREDAKAASTACETMASTDTGPSKPEWKARAERLWAAALASSGQDAQPAQEQ